MRDPESLRFLGAFVFGRPLPALANGHMTALAEVAYAHGGVVDKFVGDLIMVVFGAPLSQGEDARRAVDCARAMLQVRRRLNDGSSQPRWKWALALRQARS